jgi:hypothetical protein
MAAKGPAPAPAKEKAGPALPPKPPSHPHDRQ